MRTAVFSDLHDNLDAFYAVLDDAARHKADRFLYLGDVGHNPLLFNELRKRDIPCIYGNWEVSGLRRMSGPLQQWVATWPGVIREADAIYAHATPDMPQEAATTADAAKYMLSGIGWLGLFPRLHTNEDARWQAFAVLEETNASVAFHGHTHVQEVWAWEVNATANRQLRSFTQSGDLRLHAGNPLSPNRYLIGVGSAGQPNDGHQGKYVIYDSLGQEVSLRHI